MLSNIELQTREATVVVCPEHGAAISAYSLTDGTPVFRPSPARISGPFDLACNLMLPWCNRVSDGGFKANGQFHPLKPNLPGQAFPLHGNAFQLPWRLVSQQDDCVELELITREPAPYHYEARVRFALEGAALTVDLGVWHWGEEPLPYGIGLHPWLAKSKGTTVEFVASEAIRSDAQCLPTDRVPLDEIPEWQFANSRTLPDDGLDNAFAGWDGRATLRWPREQLTLEIETDPPQPCCHLFTPGQNADFFCFEPTSHLPNAHNWLAAEPQTLTTLSQGEGLEFRTRFTPTRG